MAAPIFILSHARSGSTLLRYLFDTHPEICCPGELRFGALCELLTLAYELTDSSEDTAEPEWDRRRANFERTRRVLTALMDDYCRSQCKPRWCEKSPHNIECLDYLSAVFPDAQCVCLYRNALDSVRSSLEVSGRGLQALDDPRALAYALDAWCRSTERLLAFEAANQNRTTRVRYEELVADANGVLMRLWAFLGVKPVDNVTSEVFRHPHRDGPGDFKIAGATAIRADRVGGGLRLNVAGLETSLRQRVVGLLDQLDY